MSESAIKLRLLELRTELLARQSLGEDKRLAIAVRIFQTVEAKVVEAKIKVLEEALADVEAAR